MVGSQDLPEFTANLRKRAALRVPLTVPAAGYLANIDNPTFINECHQRVPGRLVRIEGMTGQPRGLLADASGGNRVPLGNGENLRPLRVCRDPLQPFTRSILSRPVLAKSNANSDRAVNQKFRESWPP